MTSMVSSAFDTAAQREMIQIHRHITCSGKVGGMSNGGRVREMAIRLLNSLELGSNTLSRLPVFGRRMDKRIRVHLIQLRQVLVRESREQRPEEIRELFPRCGAGRNEHSSFISIEAGQEGYFMPFPTAPGLDGRLFDKSSGSVNDRLERPADRGVVVVEGGL